MRDVRPNIAGFDEFYGTSVHHCPDCDGYETSDKITVVLGVGRPAAALLKALRTWTSHLILMTDGKPDELEPSERQTLRQWDVPIISERIAALEGDVASRRIRAVRVVNGQSIPCDSVFFDYGSVPASNFHQALGCEVDEETGLIRVGPDQQTSVPRVFAAGDITPLSHMAVTAAAEGAIAAIHIHKLLLKEDIEHDQGSLRSLSLKD
jgi:thioredoxin reductase